MGSEQWVDVSRTEYVGVDAKSSGPGPKLQKLRFKGSGVGMGQIGRIGRIVEEKDWYGVGLVGL